MRSQFVALDSSHLGAIAADRASGDRRRLGQVEAFEKVFNETGSVLLLCFHHFQELFAHRSDEIVTQRIAYIESLPLVAIVAPFRKDGIVGSIVDLQLFEVATAFNAPAADVLSVRNNAEDGMFRLSSGADLVRPFLQQWSVFRPAFIEQEARGREIIAISRSDFAGNSDAKVVDLLRGKARTRVDTNQQFERLHERLSVDIGERGDKRIFDPKQASQAFLDDARRFDMDMTSAEGPALQILRTFDVELSEIGPKTTLADVGKLAIFRRKLKGLNKSLGLPWPELKARVAENRLPSGIIAGAIAQYHPDMRERDGSELIDRYLACLSAYADVTYVDRRTHEASRQARQKQPIFDRLVHRIEKAPHYSQIANQLQSWLRRRS